MEEKQKKTKKVNNSNKNDEAPKVEAVTKKPKTKAASSTKKETKTSKTTTAKAATKKTTDKKTTTKKATANTTKGENKTSKVKTTKKESSTSKETTAKKEEPKLTNVHGKKEKQAQENQPKQANNSAQEKQAKQENEKKETENKKCKKNYIDISIGAIICVAIIIGLIILNVKLGTRAYNVITKNETTDSKVETDNDISVTQEVGKVLSNSDYLVTQMKEKITFPPNVTASIYDAETFSTNTISNDLKLRLGWSIAEEGSILKAQNENHEGIEAIEKEIMEENIKNILGQDTKYKDESFDNTNISTFSAYSRNQGTISYSNGIYTSIVSENIETENAPLIYQEIQKVVKYTDKVIVYVKVAYMDVEENNYIVYKDFNGEEFEERLLEITPEELFGEEEFNPSTGEGTVTIDTNDSLDGIRNRLDTYKYTFSLDEETGDYYLTKFNQALSMK